MKILRETLEGFPDLGDQVRQGLESLAHPAAAEGRRLRDDPGVRACGEVCARSRLRSQRVLAYARAAIHRADVQH